MPYQTFDIKGISDSLGKWNSLNLSSNHFFNKKVLDLGCNEGFFCLKAREAGARKVIGIDMDSDIIELANQRKEKDDKIKYVACDWTELNNWKPETFDLIFLLSAMHYSSDPSNTLPNGTNHILNTVHRLLKKGGLLVFEGGIIMEDKEEWVPIEKEQGLVYYPTQKQFEKVCALLFDKVQFIGQSVKQDGDPIDRYVYHCFK